jgi:hypothetical protein
LLGEPSFGELPWYQNIDHNIDPYEVKMRPTLASHNAQAGGGSFGGSEPAGKEPNSAENAAWLARKNSIASKRQSMIRCLLNKTGQSQNLIV